MSPAAARCVSIMFCCIASCGLAWVSPVRVRVMGEDYVQTARAKGLSERSVWLKHTLRNALLSLVTIVSLQFGSLLAGSLITETIFSWPGIGRLTMQAIEMRDYPLVQGCVLAIALSYVFLNFITDLIYQWVDPRITYGN